MSIICLILFLAFPIIGLPLFLGCYIFHSNKKGIFYSILIGLTLGFITYYFIPPADYDLYRHQLIAKSIHNLPFDRFLIYSKVAELEFLPLLYSYFISFTENYNLLQFFVVSLGYTLMFYMMYDYRKKIEISNLSFALVVIFNIFGFNALYFISGLYYYIAIILFSFAFYNEYTKKGNKILSYIIYGLILLIHDSMFFPVGILLIFKLFKNKLNLKSLGLCILIFGLSYYVISFLSSMINLDIFTKVINMYNHYISNDYRMKKFYSGTIFIIEISKLALILATILLTKNKKALKKENGFIILLTVSTLLMMPKSMVMIRFIMAVQLIGIVPLMDYYKKTKLTDIKLIMMIVLLILATLYVLYFVRVFKDENFTNLNAFNNIFAILKKE